VKIMAIDPGLSRTGLAISDRSEVIASPAGVIEEKSREKLLIRIKEAVIAHQAQEVIVGYPRNMDGTAGKRAQESAELADSLRQQIPVPVRLWDERYTTRTAHSYLNAMDVRGKKRKKVIDEVAAMVILEGYLEYRKKNKEKIGGI